ncbi:MULTISPECIES: ATP-binding protein [unclassified Streptomyces]|uniref:ATP-binding protein n=1 Tax=unclassified Streptomyces TaxID=2593676 RepID=UPI00081B277F|nr:ATP-binding protein [Streptomyces sp. DvalAA-43]MYQ89083.1 DNA gyrase subunit B [Streptomyces sp. SID4936]SCE57504.1 DNA gyrase subunit B [Streptomyces sp. DvalAA-43]
MSEDATRYDASRIQVLEGAEAIRKRPGMYIGSTSERGLYQLVFEVVGRSVDEVLAGRAGAVDVTLTSDGGVRVTDDGPGVPADDAAGDTDGPGLESLLTRTRPGAWRGGRHTVVVSLSGMGPCVTNALSSRMTAEVRREGVRRVQEYARGVALTPLTAAGPATGSGTSITFWPDTGIFGTATCSFAVLAERFRELAFLNQGLRISLTDERASGESQPVRFQFPHGARDFVAFLGGARDGDPVQPDVIGFACEDPRMAGAVEVALRWCDSGDERIRSFANSAPTPEGGTHVRGFRDGVVAALTSYARQRRLLTADDPGLGPEQIGEGLTAVVSVKLDHPEFHGATHGQLGGAAVRGCVAEAVRDHIGRWLEGHPEQAEVVAGRVVRQPRPGPHRDVRSGPESGNGPCGRRGGRR